MGAAGSWLYSQKGTAGPQGVPVLAQRLSGWPVCPVLSPRVLPGRPLHTAVWWSAAVSLQVEFAFPSRVRISSAFHVVHGILDILFCETIFQRLYPF